MAVTFCICNYFNELHFFKFNNKCLRRITTKAADADKSPQLELAATGRDVHYFLRELEVSDAFRRRLNGSEVFRQCLLVITVVPPAREQMDLVWNSMITTSVWEKIEIDHLMSWLSTLGGGFSALGDNFHQCAEIAGKISIKQLNLGMRLGDPFVQSRCKLYYAISLIQTNRLKEAKRIIREQYTFAMSQKEIDHRLVKMCKGIWLKLQYAYYQKLLAKDPVKAAHIIALNGFTVF